MKIKHWQGYGCVDAKKVSRTDDTLVIHVWGMHEYGLERTDEYDVFEWLVSKFDKTRKDYRDIVSVSTDDYYTDEMYRGRYPTTEHCVYTIKFRT